jgi:hypothetical protein
MKDNNNNNNNNNNFKDKDIFSYYDLVGGNVGDVVDNNLDKDLDNLDNLDKDLDKDLDNLDNIDYLDKDLIMDDNHIGGVVDSNLDKVVVSSRDNLDGVDENIYINNKYSPIYKGSIGYTLIKEVLDKKDLDAYEKELELERALKNL